MSTAARHSTAIQFGLDKQPLANEADLLWAVSVVLATGWTLTVTKEHSGTGFDYFLQVVQDTNPSDAYWVTIKE